MLTKIEATIREQQLFDAATPVVVMVSGGSDSTALAYLMADLFERNLVGQPAILHVNHLLRGQEAYRDQEFVEGLAASLNIPFFACEIDVAKAVELSGGNVEAVGRQERYIAAHEALKSLCMHTAAPISAGRIVTAHTQDDRVENFYMRSIVGTGPGGFRSMLYTNGPVVRPCLDVSRQDLRDYLEMRVSEGLPTFHDPATNELWREDATNAHTDRFRSYVRHEIIPAAKKRNAHLLDTLTRTMNLIADEDDYMQHLASEAFQKEVEWIGVSPDESYEEVKGMLLSPTFGALAKPIQRRVVYAVLEVFLGNDVRIENSSIEAVLAGLTPEGLPQSGYVVNIQGDLAVSANKQGILIEPMQVFRTRRKRN